MRAEAERLGSQVAAKREHEAQLHAQADQYEAARNRAVSRFEDLEGQILVLEKALDAKERPQGPQRRFPRLPAHAGARAAVAARERAFGAGGLVRLRGARAAAPDAPEEAAAAEAIQRVVRGHWARGAAREWREMRVYWRGATLGQLRQVLRVQSVARGVLVPPPPSPLLRFGRTSPPRPVRIVRTLPLPSLLLFPPAFPRAAASLEGPQARARARVLAARRVEERRRAAEDRARKEEELRTKREAERAEALAEAERRRAARRPKWEVGFAAAEGGGGGLPLPTARASPLSKSYDHCR